MAALIWVELLRAPIIIYVTRRDVMKDFLLIFLLVLLIVLGFSFLFSTCQEMKVCETKCFPNTGDIGPRSTCICDMRKTVK